jgi:hypothetical protein
MVGGTTGTGAIYPLLSAGKFEIYSSSSNDSYTGTHLKSVKIEGLLGDYSPYSEVLNLNGTTPVETIADFIHVTKMIPIESGNGNVAGTITVRRKSDNQSYCMSSSNESIDGWFMCPSGYIALLNHVSITTTTSGGSVHLRVVRKGRTIYEIPFKFHGQNSMIFSEFSGVILNEGDSCYWMQTNDANTQINTGFLLADITCQVINPIMV